MLKIRVIVVDRTRTDFLKQGETFYLERLGRYARAQWVEAPPTAMRKGRSEAEVLAAEGQAILRRLAPRDHIIALDRGGRTCDSPGLAARIQRLSVAHSSLAFVIGGPLGLSAEVLARADERLSLSRLTLTHEMSRLVLLEQLYRAFTILRGEKYHK